MLDIKTLGELKKAGYRSKSVKTELRENLSRAIQNKETWYKGIVGYEKTVIPQLESAILAGHSINFLGLRGQAKTRMARMMVSLLDDYIPIIEGSELNDDPLNPITPKGKSMLAEYGDDLPISWLHKNDRYVEKLATPDVSVADLIGDVDPIKAMNEKLSFSNEAVISYGLIPRSNRGIFVINELPDLQARIQVALFNVLQENDVQIRGFNIRLPLDIAFVFTANPEDYTNRGSIVTPLKDRIQSQILTHYPKEIEDAINISDLENRVSEEVKEKISISKEIKELLEQVSVEARRSEYVDEKSGVSARLSVSLREAVFANAYRRMLRNGDESDRVRISDLYNSISAINGKIELVYEGEQEGLKNVSQLLVNKAIKSTGAKYFESLLAKDAKRNEYIRNIILFFQDKELHLLSDASVKEYKASLDISELNEVPQLKEFEDQLVAKEFLLHAMSHHGMISAFPDNDGHTFDDLLGSVFKFDDLDEGSEDKANWN